MRLYRIKHVTEITALSRSTIYRLIAAKKFPRPIHPSPGTAAWLDQDIYAWLDRQRNQHQQKQQA